LIKASEGGWDRREMNFTETMYHVGFSLSDLGSK